MQNTTKRSFVATVGALFAGMMAGAGGKPTSSVGGLRLQANPASFLMPMPTRMPMCGGRPPIGWRKIQSRRAHRERMRRQRRNAHRS